MHKIAIIVPEVKGSWVCLGSQFIQVSLVGGAEQPRYIVVKILPLFATYENQDQNQEAEIPPASERR